MMIVMVTLMVIMRVVMKMWMMMIMMCVRSVLNHDDGDDGNGNCLSYERLLRLFI